MYERNFFGCEREKKKILFFLQKENPSFVAVQRISNNKWRKERREKGKNWILLWNGLVRRKRLSSQPATYVESHLSPTQPMTPSYHKIRAKSCWGVYIEEGIFFQIAAVCRKRIPAWIMMGRFSFTEEGIEAPGLTCILLCALRGNVISWNCEPLFFSHERWSFHLEFLMKKKCRRQLSGNRRSANLQRKMPNADSGISCHRHQHFRNKEFFLSSSWKNEKKM